MSRPTDAWGTDLSPESTTAVEQALQSMVADVRADAGLDAKLDSRRAKRDRRPLFAAAAALVVVAGLVAGAILSDRSDDPPLAVEGSEDPMALIPADELFAEHERWVAVELDGEPVTDGIWIEPEDPELWESDGVISSCVWVGQRAWDLVEGRFVVHPERPAIIYECFALKMDEADRQLVQDIVFDGADIELRSHQLDLVVDDHRLRFRPSPSVAALTGSWTVASIAGLDLAGDWTIDFPPEPTSEVSFRARLSGCDLQTHEVFFTTTTLQLSTSLVDEDQPICGGVSLTESPPVVRHLETGDNTPYLVARDRIELLNEAGILELVPEDDFEPQPTVTAGPATTIPSPENVARLSVGQTQVGLGSVEGSRGVMGVRTQAGDWVGDVVEDVEDLAERLDDLDGEPRWRNQFPELTLAPGRYEILVWQLDCWGANARGCSDLELAKELPRINECSLPVTLADGDFINLHATWSWGAGCEFVEQASEAIVVEGNVTALVEHDGSVWVGSDLADGSAVVSEFDSTTGALIRTLPVASQVSHLAVGGTVVWIRTFGTPTTSPAVIQVDTGDLAALPVETATSGQGELDVDDQGAWVADTVTGILRITAGSNEAITVLDAAELRDKIPGRGSTTVPWLDSTGAGQLVLSTPNAGTAVIYSEAVGIERFDLEASALGPVAVAGDIAWFVDQSFADTGGTDLPLHWVDLSDGSTGTAEATGRVIGLVPLGNERVATVERVDGGSLAIGIAWSSSRSVEPAVAVLDSPIVAASSSPEAVWNWDSTERTVSLVIVEAA